MHTNIPNEEGIKVVKETFDKRASKNVATKVITTFLALTLTLNNFVFNWKHYLQKKPVPWVRYMHHPMQIFSWISLRRNVHTLSFKDFHHSTYDSLTIYFLYGLVLKSNSQTVWITWIKKHNSIKFEYKISQTSITFLNTKVSIQNK